MSELRAKHRGKVHIIDKKGMRLTRCGRSLGHVVDEGGTGDPVIMESSGAYILVKLDDDMAGVTCHPCRWGRGGREYGPRDY